MHVDIGSLVCGFLLGGSLYLYVMGAVLIRRGVVQQPKAWSNPDLSARTQGKGLLLCGAVFTAAGLAYLVASVAGGLVIALGLIALNLLNRRYKRLPTPMHPDRPSGQGRPPSGGASGEGHPSGR